MLSLFCVSFESGQEKSWFFVLHARSSAITENTLTLYGTGDSITGFSEAPFRETQTYTLDRFVSEWSSLFKNNDPSAAVIFANTYGAIDEHVVILKSPVIDRGDLVFQIEPVKGPIQGAFGSTLLYIGNAEKINSLPSETF